MKTFHIEQQMVHNTCAIYLVFVAIRGPKTLLTLAKLKPLLSTTFNDSDDFRHVWK